ncbi:MAG TPA: P1 family peptidase, partial [Cyclobacteriaceae bacterium]|nr:P1 family peptidase [Cyclobacteriaceae bacterium]
KGNLITDSKDPLYKTEVLTNDAVSPLFLATIEATEEAILNSMFAAKTMTGRGGSKVESLPLDKVMELMKKYGKVKRE